MKWKPKLSPLLPALVLVCLFALCIRGAEVWTGFKDISGSAMAGNEPAEQPPADMPENTSDNAAELATAETGEVSAEEAAAEDDDLISQADQPFAFSPVRAELAEDLAERRKELDEREEELMQREALLETAEKELERKYTELKELRTELEGLLTQQSEEEDERAARLVTIYEGMKAKDAANIFNTLDLDVLVSVMSRMSERKVSPILAEMNSERARTVTIMLAEEKTLPTLPDVGQPMQ